MLVKKQRKSTVFLAKGSNYNIVAHRSATDCIYAQGESETLAVLTPG